jgi:hypothetical protein
MFRDWYDMLLLTDKLAQEGLESVCANDPRTTYNLAHYLLTAGEMHHNIPVNTDSAIELEKQSRVERAIEYLWDGVNKKRMRGGNQSFLSELNFYILALGWYSLIVSYEETEQKGIAVLWNPADVFPKYSDGELTECVHEYKMPIIAAQRKATMNGWSYKPTRSTGEVIIDDYYYIDENNNLVESVLIDNKQVMAETPRDDVLLLVAPVGGFPDRGSIIPGDANWVQRVGQSILETNRATYEKINRWLTFELQILRDTAQPKYKEISMGDPKVRPEQLAQRGAVFQFNPGEDLSVINPAPIPLEIQTALVEFDREKQRGSFGDALYGMLDGNISGFALSQAIETANRVLYHYQNAKNYVISECDKFWLTKIPEGSKAFTIRGRTLEEVASKEIPEDVEVIVDSELATPRDWLEKATVANYLRDMLDDTTIMDQILNVKDPEGVRRRREIDRLEQHPQIINTKMITYCIKHAEYLRHMGDNNQAQIFEMAAQGLMNQLGALPPGQGMPAQSTEAEAARQAAAPRENRPISPEVTPPQMRRAQGANSGRE